MGYLKSIGTVIIYIGLFLAVITYLPGLPPQAEFSEYSIKSHGDVQNRLQLTNGLKGAELLFPGELKGPECFASYNGGLYTGVHGGYVVKIEENRIVPIVKFGKKCDGLWQEEKCGRPLGMKFNDKGELFVADAYYGIFKVNVNTRQYSSLFNSSEPIDGKVPRIFNSLDIAKNGDIYWTDSSTEFPLHDGIYSFLANPSGRLIRYNAATKKNEVLVRNMGFANGVLLSDDESFVIALECLTSRIIKYNLKGPKTGQHEMFAEALPGLPDNVHTDGQGGFLVSLILYVDSQYPLLLQSLVPHPYLRKMLARLLYSIEAPFKLLQDVYPNYYAERVLHSVGAFDATAVLDMAKISIVLRMDKTGNILNAIYSDDGKVHDISSAYVHNEYLWLGSPYNEYLMRVPIKQALPELVGSRKTRNVKEEQKAEPPVTNTKIPNVKVEAKPVNTKPNTQTTQKPTTTTTTTTKPTVEASTTQKPPTKTVTQKPATQAPTTTTPKPTPAVPKASEKEAKKDNTKEIKKENVKEIKKENVKEIKKENLKEIKKEEIKKENSKEIKKEEMKKENLKEIKKEEMKKENLKESKKENVKETKKDVPNHNDNAKAQNLKMKSSKKATEEAATPKPDKTVKKDVNEVKSEKVKPVEKKSDSEKK